jgi:hypothetical protein
VIPTPARLALTIDEAGRFGSVSFLADDAAARARLMELYLKLRPEIDQFEQRLQARLEVPDAPNRLPIPGTALRAIRGRPLSSSPQPSAVVAPRPGEAEGPPRAPRGGRGS